MENRPTKYWVIVASKDHVKAGLAQGIAQAGHGKEAPLKRMKMGDQLLYYSGKQTMVKPDKCQEFTAIGRVADETIYQVQVSPAFSPFRRKVDFLEGTDASILPLIDDLTFIRNKQSWGAPFRFGFLEIPQQDFDLISSNMLKHEHAH